MTARRPGTSSCTRASAYSLSATRGTTTHRFEYTPGIAALSTAAGRGFSHRSGFHSCASGPQRSSVRLHAQMARKRFVPLGMVSSDMSVPSIPRTGCESGRTVSFDALRENVSMTFSWMYERIEGGTYERNVCTPAGALKEIVQIRHRARLKQYGDSHPQRLAAYRIQVW